MIRCSCLPVSLYQEFFSGAMDIPGWAAEGAALGLDSVDIHARFFQGLSVQALQEMRKRLALPLCMVSCYNDFTNPDPAARNAAVSEAGEILEKAAALGASWVRLTAGQYYPGQDEADTIQWVYDCFQACCSFAEERGVGVLIENHSKPSAWTYPDFNFHISRFLRLWEALRSLPVYVNYDIANAYALGDWRMLLNAVSGRIATVHINDLASVRPLAFCVAGTGLVPAADILCAIRETGFDGPLCLEEAGFLGREGLRQGIAFMKHL